MVKAENKSNDVYKLALEFDKVFGLSLDVVEEGQSEDIPEEIKDLAKLRWVAKQNRNWADADKYRDEIISKGFKILDSKDGYEIKR